MCQGCGQKLREGKISQLEVKISCVLFELAKKYRGLSVINFKKAVGAGELTAFIVGSGEIGAVLGRGGKTIQEVMERLGTKVRVIEDGTDIRKQAQDVLTPAKVLGVNILYAGGGQEYRVRVPREHLRRLPASVDVVQNLLTELTDKNIRLVFE